MSQGKKNGLVGGWLDQDTTNPSLGRVSKKKEKKSREFSLTGGAGSPPFPTYFIFDFVKQLVK